MYKWSVVSYGVEDSCVQDVWMCGTYEDAKRKMHDIVEADRELYAEEEGFYVEDSSDICTTFVYGNPIGQYTIVAPKYI